MDPRHIQTHAFDTPSDEERERPPMWRFWRALPPKGKIGIFFGSWYTAPIIDRVFRNTGRGDLAQSIEEIHRFEQMLADEGALILKFWFHLSKEAAEKRLKALGTDPETRWRVTERDWDYFKLYDRFRKICGETLRATSTARRALDRGRGRRPALPHPHRRQGTARGDAQAPRRSGRARSPGSKAPPLVRPIDKRDVLARST